MPAVVLQWYAWDVKTALQTWSDQRDTTDFGLVLTSTALSGQHERSFRSLEYSGTEFHPYLEITYESPPPLTVSLKQTNLPGLKLQYDIAVSNPSKLAASSVKVAAPIPPGTTVQSAGGGTQVGSELQWTPGTLAAAGGAWNGSYTVAVTAAGAAEQAQTEQTREIIGQVTTNKEKGGTTRRTGTSRRSCLHWYSPDADGTDPASDGTSAASILISVIPPSSRSSRAARRIL